MRSQLATLAASLSTVSAFYTGFNYGSTQTDGSVKYQQDFEDEFKTAKGLVGTNGEFTSARLYTMIQGGSTADPISAIPAAIAQDTKLLLGLWASAGDAEFANELSALTAAINTYGSSFTDLVVGISVGSEDLYRDSVMGQQSNAGVGVGPDVLVNYIQQTRAAIKGTSLSGASVGHVDTWTGWTNSSVDSVVAAVDWLGMDAYPYFQSTMTNPISAGKQLFYDAYDQTTSVAQGKDVWITETGWPVSGDNSGDAVPSLANARTYWEDVACTTLGNYNVFWYTLQDADPVTPNPSFGLVGSQLTTTPLYDLSCNNVDVVSSSSTASHSSTAASSSATGSASGSASATGSATTSAHAVSGTATGTVVSSGMMTSSVSAASTMSTMVASWSSNGTATVTGTGVGSGSGSTSTASGSASATSAVSTGGAVAMSGSFLAGAGALCAAIALM